MHPPSETQHGYRSPAAPLLNPGGTVKTDGLFERDWTLKHHNILITGPTGVGKTFLATAIGLAACRQGFHVQYHLISQLLEDWALPDQLASELCCLSDLVP